MLKDQVERLYKKLSQKWARTSEVFHFDPFELRDRRLEFKDKRKPLTTREGKIRMVKEIRKILGDGGLRELDFNVPKGKVTAQQAILLNVVEEEQPSASDIAKVNDIELQKIAENAKRSIENFNQQLEGSEDLPIRELLGSDKQVRSIRGSLKVEVAKRLS